MSRPQGHRKSQSTSALNVLASGSNHHLSQSTATPRASRRPTGSGSGTASSRLGSLVEDDSEREVMGLGGYENAESLSSMVTSRTPRKERSHTAKSSSSSATNLDELRSVIGDVSYCCPLKHQADSQVRSLRSSDRRRLAAVRNIERTLVACCAQRTGISLPDFVALSGTSLVLR